MAKTYIGIGLTGSTRALDRATGVKAEDDAKVIDGDKIYFYKARTSNIPSQSDSPRIIVTQDNQAWFELMDVKNSGVTQVENEIINGTFEIWQRGESFTPGNFDHIADRWKIEVSDSTCDVSKYTLTDTEKPYESAHYGVKIDVTTENAAGGYSLIEQSVLDVRRFANRTVCIVFYAKHDGEGYLTVGGVQRFDYTSENDVPITSYEKISLTSSLKKYVVFLDFPSVDGKNIGPYSYQEVRFWLEAGSSFNTYTGSLGNQSGEFVIAEVQAYISDVELPCRRKTWDEERDLCYKYFYRYYGSKNPDTIYSQYNAGYIACMLQLPQTMIRTPTVTGGTDSPYKLGTCTVSSVYLIEKFRDVIKIIYSVTGGSVGDSGIITPHRSYVSSAWVEHPFLISAELN